MGEFTLKNKVGLPLFIYFLNKECHKKKKRKEREEKRIIKQRVTALLLSTQTCSTGIRYLDIGSCNKKHQLLQHSLNLKMSLQVVLGLGTEHIANRRSGSRAHFG